MHKEYVLYYNRKAILRDLPCNEGFDDVLKLIDDLCRMGLTIRTEDTAQMTEHELQSKYIPAIMPSVWKKYRVRGIFGTHRYAGSKFGRSVPALVVHVTPGGAAEDVFPHEESGRVVTIREFLYRLMPETPTSASMN